MTATSLPAGAGSSSSSSSYLLPPEDLSSTLSSIELLSAMWSGTDELHLSPQDESTIKLVADYLQLPLEELGGEKAKRVKEGLLAAGREEVVLGLKVRADPMAEEERWVRVSVGFKLRRGKEEEEMTRMWTSAKDAPDWLGRDGVEEVNRILAHTTTEAEEGKEEEEEEDAVGQILSKIESVSEFLLTLPPSFSSSVNNADAPTTTSPNTTASKPTENTSSSQSTPQNVHRTWFYLPSLSTKSKRIDICQLALTSTPPLTGFLLAGKPGLIVIEYPLSSPSTSAQEAALAMSAFWSTIKTTSWSDIPASHKKISEKLVEENVTQAFTDFQDVTDWPEVERGSERGRKSDLSKVIVWLDGKGVKGKWCLERCLGVGGWES